MKKMKDKIELFKIWVIINTLAVLEERGQHIPHFSSPDGIRVCYACTGAAGRNSISWLTTEEFRETQVLHLLTLHPAAKCNYNIMSSNPMTCCSR
jgi:hypothetical protein